MCQCLIERPGGRRCGRLWIRHAAFERTPNSTRNATGVPPIGCTSLYRNAKSSKGLESSHGTVAAVRERIWASLQARLPISQSSTGSNEPVDGSFRNSVSVFPLGDMGKTTSYDCLPGILQLRLAASQILHPTQLGKKCGTFLIFSTFAMQ